MKANCKICYKEFNTKPIYIKRGQGKYCSSRCYGISLKGKSSPIKGMKFIEKCGINHPNWVNRIKIKCEFCSKEFLIRQTEINKYWKKKFCSKECRFNDKSLKSLGENNPFWKGGKTPIQRAIRLSGKYNLWRLDVLKKDDFTCQECGIRGGNNLEVDHIKQFAQILFENNIINTKNAYLCDELWDINNGRTLCENCHRKTETYAKNIRFNFQLAI